METHESYVNLKTAKLLKEAGFDWEVKTYYHYLSPYDEYNLEFDSILTNYNHLNNADFSAPTLDVVQKWLREVKNWYVWTEPCKVTKPETSFPFHHISTEEWTTYVWYGINGDGHCVVSVHFYEEALENGIQACLYDIIKNKGEE